MNPEEIDDFDSYDHGWRRGIFDKCNGILRKNDNGLDVLWFAGYNDAYDSHERMI